MGRLYDYSKEKGGKWRRDSLTKPTWLGRENKNETDPSSKVNPPSLPVYEITIVICAHVSIQRGEFEYHSTIERDQNRKVLRRCIFRRAQAMSIPILSFMPSRFFLPKDCPSSFSFDRGVAAANERRKSRLDSQRAPLTPSSRGHRGGNAD